MNGYAKPSHITIGTPPKNAIELELAEVQKIFKESITVVPDASQEVYIILAVPEGDKPDKLHVIATSVTGETLEFSVKIP